MRVLLVDDNVALVETLKLMLELMGHESLGAHSAADAIRQVAQGPDVILMDIGLPDMDGYQACRDIRALPGLKQPICVAQSGRDAPEDIAKAKAAGFDHYLVKPTSFERLAGLLANIAPACKGQ